MGNRFKFWFIFEFCSIPIISEVEFHVGFILKLKDCAYICFFG